MASSKPWFESVWAPLPAEFLPLSPTIGLLQTLPPSAISGSSEERDGRPRDRRIYNRCPNSHEVQSFTDMELYCGARTNVKPTTVANNNAARARKNQRNGEHSYRLPKDSLSPRETEVGKLLAEGLNLREAALQLKISVGTATSHLREHICEIRPPRALWISHTLR